MRTLTYMYIHRFPPHMPARLQNRLKLNVIRNMLYTEFRITFGRGCSKTMVAVSYHYIDTPTHMRAISTLRISITILLEAKLLPDSLYI